MSVLSSTCYSLILELFCRFLLDFVFGSYVLLARVHCFPVSILFLSFCVFLRFLWAFCFFCGELFLFEGGPWFVLWFFPCFVPVCFLWGWFWGFLGEGVGFRGAEGVVLVYFLFYNIFKNAFLFVFVLLYFSS